MSEKIEKPQYYVGGTKSENEPDRSTDRSLF